VPATDERGPREELAPVFTALAPDIESSRTLVEQAEKDATDMLSRARNETSALLAQAQLDARSARAEAAARVAKENTDRDEALLAKARDEAEVLARTGTALIPEMTRTVVDRMLAELRQQ
jgi:vacuolar-type H+-ATPase subunit H